MRLALLIYGSLDTLSGGYLYDRKLVHHLRAAGDQVEIVSLPWRSYIHHLADNFSPVLYGRLASERWDVLLQDELNHPSLFWLNARLRSQAPYPLLSIVHHLRCSEAWPAWQKRLYAWVERRYLDSIDGFIYNSQTTRQVVEGLLGQERQAVVAYPAGDRFSPEISTAEIQARARKPGPLRLFFLGNLITRKGLHTLLDALERLPSTRGTAPGWHLEIAGGLQADPAYATAIQQRIAQLGWASQVTIHGPLPDEGLAQRLRASHALVVPSSYEGFGIAYLEGMSFGLPAIATTGGAAHEIITAGQDGFLVPSDDPAALAQALRTWLQDRARLAAMSVAARQRFLVHPTWDDSMEQARKFIHEFVRTHSRRRHADL